jgi:hypothetical protein
MRRFLSSPLVGFESESSPPHPSSAATDGTHPNHLPTAPRSIAPRYDCGRSSANPAWPSRASASPRIHALATSRPSAGVAHCRLQRDAVVESRRAWPRPCTFPSCAHKAFELFAPVARCSRALLNQILQSLEGRCTDLLARRLGRSCCPSSCAVLRGSPCSLRSARLGPPSVVLGRRRCACLSACGLRAPRGTQRDAGTGSVGERNLLRLLVTRAGGK